MEINPFTGDYWASVMLMIIGGLFSLGVLIMVAHAKWLGKTVLETRDEARSAKTEAVAHYERLLSRIENLPLAAMQSEIKSNADNIRVLDKNLGSVDGRVSILERDFERIRPKGNDNENGHR